MNYSIVKNDNDGFGWFYPMGIFKEKFGDDPGVTYSAYHANYTNNIFKKIKEFMPDAERFVHKAFINNNTELIDGEVIYISYEKSIIIAINREYEPDEIEDDQEETTKKSKKFQARILVYAFKESEELNKFLKKNISKDKTPDRKDRELNIICCSNIDGIYLKNFKTNKVDININENYNDDFIEISDNILKRLQKKHDNGIVLFHSQPGCGKTSYLRFLTQNITNKRLIYLPPDLTHRLAEPEFMTFLMNYPDSILFIEDAENALKKRKEGSSGAVSNLLNNSDGLLADALKLQIVCTFNCDVDEIDPALLRPGRLIAEYKFEKLNAHKSSLLIKKLYGEDSQLYEEQQRDGKAYTLAEIYNLNEKKFTTKKEKITIGFKQI